MRKGNKIIYNNTVYEIWEKHKNALKIYNPESEYPELTMKIIPISKARLYK